MKKVFVLVMVLILIVTVGVVFALKYGMNPKPVRVLNATEFKQPEEIGAVLFRRFYQEVRGSQLVVLGSSPFLRSYDSIWSSFLNTAVSNRVKFDSIFAMEGLRLISRNTEPYDLETIRSHLKEGKKILVHVASTDSILENISKEFPEAILIFQTGLALSQEEVLNIKPPCDEKGPDFQMSCKAQATSRRHLRKPKDKNFFVAALERHSVSKYLLFIYEPEVAP